MNKPRKPPPNAKCECSTGVDYSGPSPRVVMCREPATVTLPLAISFVETWACNRCAERLAKKYPYRFDPSEEEKL